MAHNQVQQASDKLQATALSSEYLRRLMYERIAQGNALSEVDCTAHNVLKSQANRD